LKIAKHKKMVPAQHVKVVLLLMQINVRLKLRIVNLNKGIIVKYVHQDLH